MHRSSPVAISLLAASLLTTGLAGAYNARKTAEGMPVRWETDTIAIVVGPSLAALGPGALEAASRALTAWSAVSGAAAPGVVLTEGPVDEVGYHEGEENQNTLRYVPGGYAPAGGALAITVLTFDGNGKIIDADIVINGSSSRGFAMLPDGGGKKPDTGPAMGGPYDVEDVLTHEAGHLFGLAHNDDDVNATMYFATARGETKKRDLTADDEDGLRSLYPESRDFTAACALTAAPREGRPGAAAALLLAAAVSVAARRKRAGGIVKDHQTSVVDRRVVTLSER